MNHPLRDLAAKIEALAKDHEAYAQAVPYVQNLCDHLCAVARCHEANKQIDGLRRLLEVTQQDHHSKREK